MARYLTRETEPYGKWKGIPIYLTTILAFVFVIGLIVTAVLRAGRAPVLDSLILSIPPGSAAGITGMVTYPFMGLPNFFTPFAILCFYWWGKGIETHLGRRVLATLVGILVLLPQLIGWAAWLGFGMPTTQAGNYLLTIGLVIAFATLYPNVEVWGVIPFKYFAGFCVGCALLISISDRAWLDVINIIAMCLAGFLYIRHAVEAEYDDRLPLGARIRAFFRRKPRLRVVERPAHTTYRDRPRPQHSEDDDSLEAEMDALLEKIAKSGLDSLTPGERKRLEKAREALLKKERP